MKILITGVYGIVGSEIFNELKQSHEILGIGKREKYAECINYIQCDLTDVNNLESIFKNNSDIDAIVHCAALAHNKGNDLSFNKFKEVNYDATVNLVDLSNKYLKLKKFIFLSTISVYGEKLEKDIYSEGDSCEPKSPYAVTKKMAEEYIQQNCNAKFYILRLTPVYSNKFLLNINRRIYIKNIKYTVGKGSNKLSLCNVLNIVQAISGIVENVIEVPENDIYNISDLEAYTFEQISRVSSSSKYSIIIPRLLIKLIFNINKVTLKSGFINENSIKLISDKIYPSNKIAKYIKFKYNLLDLGDNQ